MISIIQEGRGLVVDRNQIMGGILGVIVGDALGLPVQFASREARRKRPVTGMEGWGAYNMPPGSISDDGSLTLCLAESICEAGIDPEDSAARFLRWYQEGYWTPEGFAYDIGGTTAASMERLKCGIRALEAGPSGIRDNGNGSLMRIMPAVLYLALDDRESLVQGIWDISRITHGHPRACSTCYIYALMVRQLLTAGGGMEAYHRMCSLPEAEIMAGVAAEERDHFNRIFNDNLDHLTGDEIRSTGYVIDTLEAAIWCLIHNSDFESTLLTAVNLGEDTDTVGAVAGGMAGIAYGLSGIPAAWIQTLVQGEEIMALAGRFADIIIQRNHEEP